MDRQFFIVLVVIIVALGGVFVLTKDKTSAPGTGNGQNIKVSEHTIGAGNKGVTLTEYGDFECPGCEAYYPLIKQVKQAYGDDLKFQFRNFPLSSHPNAFAAHRAAEAAGKQGKFFEMHDLIYENHRQWIAKYGFSTSDASKVFEGYAGKLGLNVGQFKKDVASEAVGSTINADVKAGRALKVEQTPTFAINGKKIKTPNSFEEFKKAIDAEIAKNPAKPQ